MERSSRAAVPAERIRIARAEPLRGEGEFVLYWMIAARRLSWNFALDRSVEIARELRRPLVVLEALRSDYRWASERIHRFVIEGMAANARAAAGAPVLYFPYVEPERGAGKGLLRALSRRACAVVTDEFPCFFLPRMVEAAARQVECRLEVVDSNGLLPLSATETAAPTAYAFRRNLQKRLPEFLSSVPAASPLDGLRLPKLEKLPVREGERSWERASDALLSCAPEAMSRLPIDVSVGAGAAAGGSALAAQRLRSFLEERLSSYPGSRRHPDEEGGSGLSPYLHFGHLSVHQGLVELAERESWSPEDVAASATGAREGWWRMSPAAEAFLDELVTWRELGYHFCRHRPDYAEYDSLPEWARATLARHAGDERPWTYTAEELERAATHDALWNAAQRQLVAEGRMHNYLRMLWGKKVLEWSSSPREAFETLVELNNRYALDGRNPSSYSGISWCFGRFDRPWGPEREIFGTVRYMSSANTGRKVRLREYLARWAPPAGQLPLA
jgi:deoxyribodipyrimidine photo-lyase